jgi:hypothetical protein
MRGGDGDRRLSEEEGDLQLLYLLIHVLIQLLVLCHALLRAPAKSYRGRSRDLRRDAQILPQ